MSKVRLRSVKKSRWTKGDACESNPKIYKHRKKINWKEISKNRLLISAPQTSELIASSIANNDNMINPCQSIGGLSNSSICTFGNIIKKFKTSDDFSQEVLAVLNSAVKTTEESVENPTDNDYFCSLVSLLNPEKQMKNVTSSLIYLLVLVIKKVSDSLIIKVISLLLPKVLYIINNLDDYGKSFTHILKCAFVLLKKIPMETLKSNTNSVELLTTKILTLLSHNNNNVSNLTENLFKNLFECCNGYALPFYKYHTFNYLKIFLNTATTYSTMNTCHELLPKMLLFTSDIMPYFSEKNNAVILNLTLKCLVTSDKKTRMMILEFWKRVFNSKITLSLQYINLQQHIYKTTNELWMESVGDYENILLNILVSDVSAAIVAYICKTDVDKGIPLVSDYLELFYSRILNRGVLAYKTIVDTIKNILCVDIILNENEDESLLYQRKMNLIECYKILVNGMSVGKDNPLFESMIDTIHCYTEYFGPNFSDHLLVSIDPLMTHLNNSSVTDEISSSIKNKLITTLGTVLSTVGPEKFISQININSFPDMCWLFQFIKSNIRYNVSILMYTHQIYPLLCNLSKTNTFLQTNATSDLITYYGWDMLSSFCLYGNDIDELKSFSNVLVHLLQDSDNSYSPIVFKCLRNIVYNKVDINKDIAFFSKKFLPILFNLYINGIKHSNQSVPYPPSYVMDGTLLDTIRSLLQGSNYDLTVSFFDKAVDKITLLSDSKLVHLLEIIAEFSLYVPTSRVDMLFNKVVVIYFDQILQQYQQKQSFDIKLLKKILHIVENILSNKCCQKNLLMDKYHEQIITIIDTSTNISANNSIQSAKLACLNAYLNVVSSDIEVAKAFIIKYLPEIILSFGNTSGKCRHRGTRILVNMTNILAPATTIDHVVDTFINYMLQGLDGTLESITASMRAILFYIKIFKYQLPESLQSTIYDSILSHMKNIKEPSAIRAILNFFKIAIKAFSPVVTEKYCSLMLDIIFSYQQPTLLSKFNRDLKIIFERLLSKLSFDKINNATPLNHKKLLIAVAKELRAQKNKFKDKKAKINAIKTTKNNDSKLHNVINSNQCLVESDDPVDLFSQKLQHQSLTATDSSHFHHEIGSDIEYKLDSTGKIIIGMPKNSLKASNTSDSESDDDDDDEQCEKNLSSSTQNIRFNRKTPGQLKSKNLPSYGQQYKAKKAHGDMKLRGKPDPYAYVPLNGQMLNTRKAAKLRGRFNNIVKAVNKNKRH